MKTNQTFKKILLLAGLFVWLFRNAAYSGDQFQISLDQAQFLGSDNQCYLEIYYSYPENSQQYQKQENNEFGCAVYFTLNIYQNDSLWANKQWKIEKQLPDTTNLSTSKKYLVDLIRYAIQSEHRYTIRLFARDFYSGEIDSAQIVLTGRNFLESQICMSDLLLASSVQPFTQMSDAKFRKKIYEIVPNPNLSYGIDLHELFYYFEIYHLTQAKPDSQYAILWQIQDSTGKVIISNSNSLDWRSLVHESSREIGQIGVWDLDNGSYMLSCYLQTTSGKFSEITNSKKFLVYKKLEPSPATAEPMQVELPTFLDGYDEKQIDLEYDQMYALTSKEIRKIYSNIKVLTEKKSLLYNLWMMNASEAGASARDFRYDFLQRIKEANEKYKSSFKPGWKTDQGIIFLKYGSPSDIERHHSESGTKPYEVWRYEEIEGGVIFVFIDRIGFNQYELIHSTKRGELSEPNWTRYISTNPLDKY